MASLDRRSRLAEGLRNSMPGRAASDLLWGGPARKLEALIAAPAAAIARAPIDLLRGGVGSVLLGRRNVNPASPMFGKRLRGVRGGPDKGGMVPITKAEYDKIISGNQPGKAYAGKVGGKGTYYKRRYVHGGLVGFARKHPVLATGGGLLAFYLANSPSLRAAGGAMVPDLGRSPKIHSGVRSQWAAPPQRQTSTQAWG